MSNQLAGKVAWVTGGGSGIGRDRFLRFSGPGTLPEPLGRRQECWPLLPA